jgi:hypothetical protein
MSHIQDPSSPEKKFPCLSWDSGELYINARKVYGIKLSPRSLEDARDSIEKAFWAGMKYAQHGTVS